MPTSPSKSKVPPLSKEFLDFCKRHVVNGLLTTGEIKHFGYAALFEGKLKEAVFMSGKDQTIPIEHLNTLYQLDILKISADVTLPMDLWKGLTPPPYVIKGNKLSRQMKTLYGTEATMVQLGIYKSLFVPLKRYLKHGFSVQDYS